MTSQELISSIPEYRKKLLYFSNLDSRFYDFIRYTIFECEKSSVEFTIIKEENGWSSSHRLKNRNDKIESVYNEYLNVSDNAIVLHQLDEKKPEFNAIPESKLLLIELESHTIFTYFDVEFTSDIINLPTNEYLINSRLYYSLLPPKFRYKYLQWLNDTTCPIERKYIIMYLSGLERRAIEKQYKEAISEIVILLNSHEDTIVQKRCRIAINNIFYVKNDLSGLHSLYKSNSLMLISDHLLEFYISQNLNLNSKDVYNVFIHFKFKLGIMKNHEDIYLKSIENVLMTKYSANEMPFGSEYFLEDIPKSSHYFTNHHLFESIGDISICSFKQLNSFYNDIKSVYDESYVLFKTYQKQIKKK